MRGVSRTALWVASMRAEEAARPDRLHDDPLAAAALSLGEQIPAAPPGAAEFMAVRTRFYDNFLRDSGLPQVVALAAGLDARAFRLDWPSGTRVFELDLPELLEFKENLVTTTAVVPPLHPRSRPGGPAHRLDPSLGRGGFRRVGTDRSRFAFDHMDTSADDRESVADTLDRIRGMGAEFVATAADPAGRLAAHGWTTTVDRVPELAVAYGRPLPDFMDPAAANATALCTAAN